jgi:hypothetical protein
MKSIIRFCLVNFLQRYYQGVWNWREVLSGKDWGEMEGDNNSIKAGP